MPARLLAEAALSSVGMFYVIHVDAANCLFSGTHSLPTACSQRVSCPAQAHSMSSTWKQLPLTDCVSDCKQQSLIHVLQPHCLRAEDVLSSIGTFHVIHVGAAATEDMLPRLTRLLSPGGRMVVPVGPALELQVGGSFRKGVGGPLGQWRIRPSLRQCMPLEGV